MFARIVCGNFQKKKTRNNNSVYQAITTPQQIDNIWKLNRVVNKEFREEKLFPTHAQKKKIIIKTKTHFQTLTHKNQHNDGGRLFGRSSAGGLLSRIERKFENRQLNIRRQTSEYYKYYLNEQTKQ